MNDIRLGNDATFAGGPLPGTAFRTLSSGLSE